jgi:FKBP-type peptidyl-prolyl cis-trans isomerase SlpA
MSKLQPSREIITGSFVTMHFSLSLADGTEAISTFDDEPVTLQMGDGTLMPTLEMVIYGLTAGDEQERHLCELEAFGPRDKNMVTRMQHSDFPADANPELGAVINFATDDGAEAPGQIIAVENDGVLVDFNHPLAGKNVIFRVSILHVQNGGSR